jgi:hypothetical protein
MAARRAKAKPFRRTGRGIEEPAPALGGKAENPTWAIQGPLMTLSGVWYLHVEPIKRDGNEAV